ncbi:M3 family metallopeptidase [Alteromonadaceae bacterium BrNp21-10]|nr:M3 family metallopeptidase [Alteromonadaceae bacterium BrNp21-10]
MIIKRIGLATLCLASVSAFASSPYDATPEEIATHCQSYIDTFNTQMTALTTSKEAATYETVMRPFDAMMMEFGAPLLHDNLMKNVHTDEAIRKASTECTLKGFAIFNGMSMNRPLYERISQVSTEGLEPAQAYTVNYWMKQFEASGIGKDQATRDKIQAQLDEITDISNTFSQNITDDVRSISVAAERLAGAPADYIAGHPVDDKGMVTITTSYSDISPIFKYVHDRALRKDVLTMFNSRAYPQNKAVLEELIAKRYELARMLDHDNYAQLDMVGTMVEEPNKVETFTASLSAAIKAPVVREKARLLARMQKVDKGIKTLESWDASYASNLIREEDYQLDSKQVREYFDYDKVRDGIVELAQDLFSIAIKPVTVATWHESVEAYEVYENDKLIGKFFFDSHPRAGKYTHAAQFGLKLGKAGVELPEAALLMNFPKGLMEHGQVETFLHEFGHLLHFIFAGQNDIGFSRFQGEADFGEAPSTMLEEWVWDYDTLKKFATNAKGEVIPKALVEKMNKARYFGQALGTATQLTYTALSLQLYNQPPQGLELDEFERKIYAEYANYDLMEGTHPYASFGHLAGYGAKYYTYQWSNAIAEELLSRFKKEGLRNKQTANDYRHKVLAVTGTRSSGELVKDFLGRDFGVKAYADKLSK